MQTSQCAVYQLKDDPSMKKLQSKTYEELQQENIAVRIDNYKQVYIGMMQAGETPSAVKSRLDIQKPRNFKGHSIGVSDVLVLTDAGDTKAYYIDKNDFIILDGFLKKVEGTGNALAMDMEGVVIDGKAGTWTVIDVTTVEEQDFFLMEHEKYGSQAAYVVLDQNRKVVANDNYNGFDDAVMKKINDYLHPPKIEVPEHSQSQRPILPNWEKYCENGEYLKNAQKEGNADYRVIDKMASDRARKKDKDRPRESVLAKLHEKQKAIARRKGAAQPLMEMEEVQRKRQ
jgi:hypothetical protein